MRPSAPADKRRRCGSRGEPYHHNLAGQSRRSRLPESPDVRSLGHRLAGIASRPLALRQTDDHVAVALARAAPTASAAA
jgi:hypothetical protein